MPNTPKVLGLRARTTRGGGRLRRHSHAAAHTGKIKKHRSKLCVSNGRSPNDFKILKTRTGSTASVDFNILLSVLNRTGLNRRRRHQQLATPTAIRTLTSRPSIGILL